MKRLVILLLLVCLPFVAADGEDNILLFRGESIDIDGSVITLVDVYSDNSLLLRVDSFEHRLATKGRWVDIGPLEVKLTGVYNRVDSAKDQGAFKVRGYTIPEVVEVPTFVEQIDEPILFAGDSYSYGGHIFMLIRTTETHATLLIDGVEVEIRESYDLEVGEVTVKVKYVSTNLLDSSLDRADLLFTGANSLGSEVESPIVPTSTVELNPVHDGFAETQVITVEPTPEPVVFDKAEGIASGEEDVAEIPSEIAEILIEKGSAVEVE